MFDHNSEVSRGHPFYQSGKSDVAYLGREQTSDQDWLRPP